MNIALVYTESPALITALQGVLPIINAPIKVVGSFFEASDWLKNQQFGMVVFDVTNKEIDQNSFIEMVLAHNPLVLCVLVSFGSKVEGASFYRQKGLEIIDGQNAFQQLLKVISSRVNNWVRSAPYGVILVEDLDSPRFIVTTLISSLGYSPVVAFDGAEKAMQHIKKNSQNYSCVVTDLSMPEHSGLELLSWIREDADTEHLPVVVLTAYSTSEHLVEAVCKGATGFLVKPVKKQELKAELVKAQRIVHNRLSPRMFAEVDEAKVESILLNFLTNQASQRV